jgi:hypothetical protein
LTQIFLSRVHQRCRNCRLHDLPITSARICSCVTSGLCWLDTTTASTRTGVFPRTDRHDLPSGRRYFSVPSRRRRRSFHELVRQHDRQRHQLLGLRARKPEHQPLVAGAPVSTPIAISGDWLWIGDNTAHVSAS